MRRLSKFEVLQALIARVTLHLAECVECSWAVAMCGFDVGARPLYIYGHPCDLDRCVAYLESVLPKLVSGSSPLAECDDSTCESWGPRIICPIYGDGELLALLAFGPKIVSAYSTKDHQLIRGFAAHLSFLMTDDRSVARFLLEIARHERRQFELDCARRVQQRFFPYRRPEVEGLDYYGECQPVGEVGGDFFDVIV
jgi:hypothetical protein